MTSKPQNQPIYVYLIQAGKKKNSPVKVGYSKDPESRLKQLQTGNHEFLNLIMKIKCANYDHARRLELDMHRILGSQNVCLEWYKMNKSHVMKILNRLAKSEAEGGIEVVETVKNLSDCASKDVKVKPESESVSKNLKDKIKSLHKQIELLEVSAKRRKREAGIMYGYIYDTTGKTTKETKQLFVEEE